MTGTRTRPNANPILDMMRDGDTGDMFGLAMGYGFAIAEVLYDADPHMVPSEWGYRPALAGPEVPSGSAEDPVHHITLKDLPYETVEVWCWLHQVDPDAPTDPEDLPYWSDPAFAARAETLLFAGRCVHRLVTWLEAAGQSY